MTDTPEAIMARAIIRDNYSLEWAEAYVKKQIAALHAAGYEIVQGWKPIESAPRDGTEILGWEKSEGMAIIAYRPDMAGNTKYEWFNLDHGTPYCPTHWRPRPAPPEGEG